MQKSPIQKYIKWQGNFYSSLSPHLNLISQKKLKHFVEKPLSQIHNCEEVDVLYCEILKTNNQKAESK